MSQADTAVGGPSTGALPTTGSTGAIPPLDEQGTPTSPGVVRRPLFARDGSPRSQPSPPAGPPPPRRPPPGMAEPLDMKLPGIGVQAVDDRPPSGGSKLLSVAISSHDNSDTGASKENKREKNVGKRIDIIARHAPALTTTLAALPESEDVRAGRHGFEGSQGVQLASPLAVEGKSRAEPRLSAEIALAARKAQRVAEVRNIAQEVARVTEDDANAGADEKERGEIERALAAVDETRRKRMQRQQAEHGEVQQDEEKLRRRQAKREQLMKKRRDMEERLEEEATKMAELTESAKKKGESKFMSEEAKRDAEERIRAEAEVVAQLERQAAEMVLQRENMQKQLAERELQKVAEIEANSSALKTKRALVEARMRQEEEEIKSLSEAAKREVEAKMAAEAAAIAEMERQALEMSAKRAELQADMSNKLQLEDTMVREAQLIARKREEIEAKMQQEEAELQKLSEDAKKRVLEKMAAEAAAIADMEREASKLAEERAALASQMAKQRSSKPSDDSDRETPVAPISPQDNSHADLLESQEAPIDTAPHDHASDAAPGFSNNVAAAPVPMYLEELMDVGTDHAGPPLAGSDAIEHKPWDEEPIPSSGDPTDSNVCQHCRTHQRDLSSAHLAAAAGHVTCLEAIQLAERGMLAEVDSSGRSPLFYACANAHADAADLLIQESPQSCHAMDVNGDTPLHAASLAGSRLCCRLLLQQGQSEVEPLNQMQMTPAHLAANNDVLEVLSQHGANLNAKDADLRTPLFVACASDRLEKAELLCELLEYADQDLGEADKRGDTPMHAAAYNGSTACLLLLLQYGVEPDARNTKGLRPIDLASRRGQTACEKILMEYQLHHHVNNSYFDSVLFLATLEGHKRCKETLNNNTKHQGEVATDAQADSPLARPQSLMSLRRERSVRLEHWGDWIAYEDQNEKSVFWYNHVEDKSQRDAPTGVREASASSLSKASMRLKRQGDWIEYTLPDGNVFYYNDKNNEFQWERPDDLSSHAPSQEWADEDGRLDDAANADKSTGDWTAFKDPSTGLVFWYNHVTDESQWEPPEQNNTADGGETQTAVSCVNGSLAPEEEDVREINDEDDLFTPR